MKWNANFKLLDGLRDASIIRKDIVLPAEPPLPELEIRIMNLQHFLSADFELRDKEVFFFEAGSALKF